MFSLCFLIDALELTTAPTDPQQRAAFDRHGSDPEDRSAGRSHPGFATSPFGNGGGARFEGELSPEDLFNMFFGGGGAMGGGPFGNGGPSKFLYSRQTDKF